MRARASRLPWLLAVLLAAGVVAELGWPRGKIAPPRPPALAAANGGAFPVEPVAAWAAVALARPVFSPARRPDAPGAQPAAAEPTRPEPPRLAGILVTPGGRRAIFAGNPAGPAAVVGEGGAIGPWRVEAIHAGDVQLAGPAGRRTVRPAYSDAPATPPPPPVPAAATGLLPPLPQPDTRPFNAIRQPSGADIFLNAPGASAARTSR